MKIRTFFRIQDTKPRLTTTDLFQRSRLQVIENTAAAKHSKGEANVAAQKVSEAIERVYSEANDLFVCDASVNIGATGDSEHGNVLFTAHDIDVIIEKHNAVAIRLRELCDALADLRITQQPVDPNLQHLGN